MPWTRKGQLWATWGQVVPSVNQILADKTIGHAVDFQQYSNQVVRRIMAVLNRSDDRLYAELVQALASIDPSSFTVERLESMLYSVRSVNAQAFAAAAKELTEQLRDFTAYEAAYQAQTLVSVLPVQVSVAAVSADVVFAAALARPFQGVLLKGVLADIEESKAKKIRQAIAQGFTESKTTDQIIRELRGTKAKGYADGFLEGSRRDIEAITRTALGHMAGFTQDRFIEANTDLISAVVWCSTIDLKTSPICRIRDGLKYTPETHKPIGHSVPWGQGPGRAHWNCRSHQTTVLKSYKELGIDISEVVVDGKTRASMDGQLPSDTTYNEWIKKQSAARQDEVLGSSRGKLLRDGKMNPADMYSSKGVFLTLEQLRARDAVAFSKAGL